MLASLWRIFILDCTLLELAGRELVLRGRLRLLSWRIRVRYPLEYARDVGGKGVNLDDRVERG